MRKTLFVILVLLLRVEAVWSQTLSWEPVIEDGNVKACLDCKGDQAVLDIIYPYKDLRITYPYSGFTREWNGYRHRVTFNNSNYTYVTIKHGNMDLTIHLLNDNKLKLERQTVKTVRINQTPVDGSKVLDYFDNGKVSNYFKNSSSGQSGYNWVEIDVASPIKIELDSDLELKDGRRIVGDNYVFVVRIPDKQRILNFFSEGYYPITIPIDVSRFQKNCTYEIVVDVPNLKPKTKKYTITANVSDFAMYIDGKECKGDRYSYSRTVELQDGKHSGVVYKDGYKTKNFEVVYEKTSIALEKIPDPTPRTEYKTEYKTVEKTIDKYPVRFFVGYSGSSKAPIGLNFGLAKDKIGLFVDAKASLPVLKYRDIYYSPLYETTGLSQTVWDNSKSIGVYTYSLHLGQMYKWQMFDEDYELVFMLGAGYCRYSNLYEYNSSYYTPALHKGLSIEAGVGLLLRQNFMLTCSYSRLMSDRVYADINLGLSYYFGK